ncbi:proton pump-interactor 1-like [Hibiscus syriacus]|uniref:proton pump-interactor 1-like n=1 Tax=Hibiscus syriacus TaxID=106335 RepID=UPI0019205339|nr:proton pump-interactor 1-like [Hibiscus syriacus]XP_039030213.1 proton pump-interactor 1-like [Hibiscus syriacus]
MGVEVVGSEMVKVSVDNATEVDESLLHDKENGKLDKDRVHSEPIEVGSDAEEPNKGEEKNVSDANFPSDAVADWPAPKQIHYFYFVRYRPFDDPKIKAKTDQVDKEMQKLNKLRFQLIDELKSYKSDRAELLSQVKALNVDFEQFKTMLGEKKKEMEPLQQALGKLRNNNNGGGRGGMCSSEEELNDLIYSLQYRIQHESIPLSEEKQLLREIKQLEGTRDKVIANAAMRTKIQESLGQKEDIQDQVKLMGNDLDGVRKEQNAIWSKKKQIKEKVNAIESKIEALQEELNTVIQKRNKAYETMQQLWKQRDEANAHFYQSRSLLNKAKELAAKKDIKGLEELSTVEVEKFMALWSSKKAVRDDYEKRVLLSLDQRQLSRDGRIRNPDEKPLVVQVAPVPSAPETIPKPSVRQPKEEAKPSPEPDTKPKKGKKDADIKLVESKSSPKNDAVAEKEISGSGNLQKEAEKKSAEKEIDAAKLKEMKREEEIAKAKQAMERKKKKAEEKAAKAAIRAQKEAEKKLKDREKKAKNKAAACANTEEPTEAVVEAPEPEKDENADAAVPASVVGKDKVQKENTIRYRNRTKGRDSLPRPILKRKKSTNYWMWAAPAALVVLVLIALGYYYLA